MNEEAHDLLHAATAALTAARKDLAEVDRQRGAELADQVGLATRLSRSRQLSPELSDVAAEAVTSRRADAAATQAAIDERRDLLDKVNADIASLVGLLEEPR